MAYDIHVLAHAVVYFAIFVFGFIVAIPLGVTVVEFDNKCILYTEFDWNDDKDKVEVTANPNVGVCNFPVFTAVFACIFYGLIMGIYNMYAVCKTKDPNIGFQMWIMPFTLITALILIVMFVGSCIISVGLKSTCNSLLKLKGDNFSKCADGEDMDQVDTNYNVDHMYSYPKTSEVAAWITCLLWLVQLALYILRIIRNRRLRSQGIEPNTEQDTKPPADMENFASVKPTA